MLDTIILLSKSYITFISLLFIGHTILSFIKFEFKNQLLSNFIKLTTGIVFIVCIFSIVKSNFNTVNTSIVITIVTYLLLKPGIFTYPKNIFTSFINKAFIETSFVFFIISLIFYAVFYNNNGSINLKYGFHHQTSQRISSSPSTSGWMKPS